MQSFLAGKKVITSTPLRADHGAGSAVARTLKCSFETPEPAIEVVKEGDKVVRLIVTCACGERIEVNCLYAAGH